MSTSLQRVRPTKIELIKLRRRLELARKVHKILRERLTILVNEFFTRLREAVELRRAVYSKLTKVYLDTLILYGAYGESIFDYMKGFASKPMTAVVGLENIMGVKTHSAIVSKPSYLEEQVIPYIQTYRDQVIELLSNIVNLGRADKAVESLGKEIVKTKRKVNALEYYLIPAIERTVRYLRMKFEEREREEKARMKRVKQVLTRRKTL